MALRAGGILKDAGRGCLIAATALLGGCAVAGGPPEPGAYSSVWVHHETGDQLGANLVVFDGDAPEVEFELCEGWCNGALRAKAMRTKSSLDFTVSQPLTDGRGNSVPPQVYRVRAQQVRSLFGQRVRLLYPDFAGEASDDKLLRRVGPPRHVDEAR